MISQTKYAVGEVEISSEQLEITKRIKPKSN